MDLDQTHKRILALLEKDARISVTEIARQVNLSRPAVQERIAALEANGIIQGYQTRIATSAQLTHAVIFAQIAERPCGPTLEWLASLEGVTSVQSLSGEIDALVQVSLPSMAALSALNDKLAASPLIASAKSSAVLQRLPRL